VSGAQVVRRNVERENRTCGNDRRGRHSFTVVLAL